MTDTSVIIPVLNGEKYIAHAHASIAGQLAPDDEIIVVDNGSTDATVAIVNALGDKRIQVLTEAKRGPAAARNRALQVASGTCIAFLDHDDLWPPDRHIRMRQLLGGDVDAVCGRLTIRFDDEIDPIYAAMDDTYLADVSLCTYLFRHASIKPCGGLDESLQFGEDIDFLLRYRQLGVRVAPFDGAALIYRRHRSNMTLDLGSRKRGALDMLRRNMLRQRKD